MTATRGKDKGGGVVATLQILFQRDLSQDLQLKADINIFLAYCFGFSDALGLYD